MQRALALCPWLGPPPRCETRRRALLGAAVPRPVPPVGRRKTVPVWRPPGAGPGSARLRRESAPGRDRDRGPASSSSASLGPGPSPSPRPSPSLSLSRILSLYFPIHLYLPIYIEESREETCARERGEGSRANIPAAAATAAATATAAFRPDFIRVRNTHTRMRWYRHRCRRIHKPTFTAPPSSSFPPF